MTIPTKPLGIIKDLVEGVGLDVTYAYEDLIFIEHNAFILQMEENPEDIGVWFNTQSTEEDRPKILSQLQGQGKNLKLNVLQKGTFSMNGDGESEAIQIVFNQ